MRAFLAAIATTARPNPLRSFSFNAVNGGQKATPDGGVNQKR